MATQKAGIRSWRIVYMQIENKACPAHGLSTPQYMLATPLTFGPEDSTDGALPVASYLAYFPHSTSPQDQEGQGRTNINFLFVYLPLPRHDSQASTEKTSSSIKARVF